MRPQIVLFGDSITEQSFSSGGWGASLANNYCKADILNRGFGGYNTRWALFLLDHLFPLESSKHPAVTIIFFGANDAALSGRTSERSVNGDKPMELPERTNAVTGEYAKQCVELARELGLPSINLWSIMQETRGWQKKFLSDGLNLTPIGNAVVYYKLEKVLSEAWFYAAQLPYDFPDHSEIDGKNPKKAFQIQCPGLKQ